MKLISFGLVYVFISNAGGQGDRLKTSAIATYLQQMGIDVWSWPRESAGEHGEWAGAAWKAAERADAFVVLLGSADNERASLEHALALASEKPVVTVLTSTVRAPTLIDHEFAVEFQGTRMADSEATRLSRLVLAGGANVRALTAPRAIRIPPFGDREPVSRGTTYERVLPLVYVARSVTMVTALCFAFTQLLIAVGVVDTHVTGGFVAALLIAAPLTVSLVFESVWARTHRPKGDMRLEQGGEAAAEVEREGHA